MIRSKDDLELLRALSTFDPHDLFALCKKFLFPPTPWLSQRIINICLSSGIRKKYTTIPKIAETTSDKKIYIYRWFVP